MFERGLATFVAKITLLIKISGISGKYGTNMNREKKIFFLMVQRFLVSKEQTPCSIDKTAAFILLE